MNVQSTHFIVGTGPLFDFKVCGENGLCGVVGCSVSLSASSLTNTTSTRLSSRFSPSCSFLTQRLIGTSISHSTNHLSGTSGTELNWAGSTLLSNSSFSSCVTNDAPAPITEPPTPTPTSSVQYVTGSQTRFELLFGTPTGNQLWLVSCTFADVFQNYGGAVYIAQTSTAVYLKDTTFQQCTAVSGGAVIVSFGAKPEPELTRSVTFFNCKFSNNTATQQGGHFFLQWTHPNTIAQCTFEDSRSDTETPLTQVTPIQSDADGLFRFDNTTFSANEGTVTGCFRITQKSADFSLVLTNLLFVENVCTSSDFSSQTHDLLILNGSQGPVSAFACFSTSSFPKSRRDTSNQIPECVGPSILNVGIKEKVSADGKSLDVELTSEAVSNPLRSKRFEEESFWEYLNYATLPAGTGSALQADEAELTARIHNCGNQNEKSHLTSLFLKNSTQFNALLLPSSLRALHPVGTREFKLSFSHTASLTASTTRSNHHSTHFKHPASCSCPGIVIFATSRAKIPVGADGSEITKLHQTKPNDGGDQVHDLKRAGEDEEGASVIPIHVRGNTITPVQTSELVDELINPPMTQTSRGRSM
ncbi:hypothetical protein BLNAU_14080 [Blattamonas nauphoetae]|uniref:Uncharacterized protein n=1 Tax=Blattamonas nauphoetae TaxID=2049346 RepID=A0ABQ9XI18_9EUKA|nr:hypothetical protein BLNAU_14080 [Blattamonas nauphoetae]